MGYKSKVRTGTEFSKAGYEAVRSKLVNAYAVVRDGLVSNYTKGVSAYTYLSCPGSNTNYASVPDAAALDITGDIDMRGVVALTDWTPAGFSHILGKFTAAGNQKSYDFILKNGSGGILEITWSENGSAEKSADSTAAPTIANGEILAVRATLDVDNGAAGRDIKFYTKTTTPQTALADVRSNTGWTQLGATVTQATATSIFAGTAILTVGAEVGSSPVLTGKAYAICIQSGIAGTEALVIDFTNLVEGTTSFTAVTGQTVTINQSGGTPAQILGA